uniref:Tyrosine-protein phosphatase domain-containing protein n=1 Tax=Steinernema glaseri TaxID=37863 RepID=A0A1I7Y2G9_9BILA
MAERPTASKTKARPSLSRGRQGRTMAQTNRRATAENKASVGAKRRSTLEIAKPIGLTFQSKIGAKSTSSRVHLTPKQQSAEKFLDTIMDLGMRGMRKEFLTSVRPYTSSGPKLAWRILENKDKNRYEDVELLDDTRVKLKNNSETGKPHDDYIHASWVKVHDDLMYICAQGPLPNTIHHFWLMVLQEKSKVILQLCSFFEEDKEKCAQYFPTEAEGNSWKAYGPVEVRVLERQTNIPTMKKVVKTKLQVKLKDETLDVLHILYGGWPDHSVADSVTCCREVHALVHKVFEKKPIVAHCSAGIGRTGTFVAVDMCLHRIVTLNDMTFTLPDITKDLRDQRFKAIQNDQQYVFVSRAVIEILVHDDVLEKSDRVIGFISEYDELVARKRQEREKANKEKEKDKSSTR